MVQVLEKGKGEVRCHECKSLLSYEQADLTPHNYAVTYAGETDDWYLTLDCPECKTTLKIRSCPKPDRCES